MRNCGKSRTICLHVLAKNSILHISKLDGSYFTFLISEINWFLLKSHPSTWENWSYSTEIINIDIELKISTHV